MSTFGHILVGFHCQLGKGGFIPLSGGVGSRAAFPPAVQDCDGAVLGTTTSPADGNALEVTLSL